MGRTAIADYREFVRGADTCENLQTLCLPCNRGKGAQV